MMSRCSLLLGGSSVAVLLGLAGPVHAAFAVKGEGLARLSGSTVTVLRQSIEVRTEEPVASARVANGVLNLRVNAEPGLFTMEAGDFTGSFVAGNDQTIRLIALSGGSDLRIEGDRDQELFLAYENLRAESLARKVTPVREAIVLHSVVGNTAEVARLTDAEVAAYRDHRRELNDFTLEKLRGSPALYAASLRWDGDYRLEDLANAVQDYSRQFPGTEVARLMEERIQRFRATAIGAVAPSLTGPTPTGGQLALADLRGRYVLVDFWASWCGPCRLENQNYAALYQRYRPAGFEILAVSVDETAAVWKSGIAKDKAVWRHLSDLKGWRSPLAAAYNVAALPASFLLDPEGRIIAKDLRGKQLAARLESLFASVPKAR